MPLGTFTVTIDGNRLGAGTETTAKIQVKLAAGRQAVKDADAGLFWFPHVSNPTPIAVSLPQTITLVTDVDTGVSEEIGYVITVTTATNGKVVAGPFAAQAADSTWDLTDLAADFVGTVPEDIALRAEAARDDVLAVVATTEGLMTSVLGSGGTFDTELSATIAAAVPAEVIAALADDDTPAAAAAAAVDAEVAELARPLYLDGTDANYVSTPDAAALDLTGDLDLRAEVALTDWTPASSATLLAKYLSTGSQRSYMMFIDTTGRLAFSSSANGSTGVTQVSSVLGFLDGEKRAVRVTVDVDNGAGSHVINFYKADSIEGPWTLVSTTNPAGTLSIFSGSAPLTVGAINTGTANKLIGKVYRVAARTGIDGSVVASLDLRTPFPSRLRDAQANIWTLNGSAYAWSAPEAAAAEWAG